MVVPPEVALGAVLVVGGVVDVAFVAVLVVPALVVLGTVVELVGMVVVLAPVLVVAPGERVAG